MSFGRPVTSKFVVNIDVYKVYKDEDGAQTEMKMRIRPTEQINDRVYFDLKLKFKNFHAGTVPSLIEEIVTFPMLPNKSLDLQEATEILKYQLGNPRSAFHALASVERFFPLLPDNLLVKAFYCNTIQPTPEEAWEVRAWKIPKSGCYRWSAPLGTKYIVRYLFCNMFVHNSNNNL